MTDQRTSQEAVEVDEIIEEEEGVVDEALIVVVLGKDMTKSICR